MLLLDPLTCLSQGTYFLKSFTKIYLLGVSYSHLVEMVKIECCIHIQRRPKPNYASVNFYREIANSGLAS